MPPTALRRALTSLRRLLRPHRMDLVYSPACAVRIDGVQFDPERGERILTFLLSEGLVGWRRVLRPEPASVSDLLSVHTRGLPRVPAPRRGLRPDPRLPAQRRPARARAGGAADPGRRHHPGGPPRASPTAGSPPTCRAGCTTPGPRPAAATASTTTSPWRSSPCAATASPSRCWWSTSTCTTATAPGRPSPATRRSSPSRSTTATGIRARPWPRSRSCSTARSTTSATSRPCAPSCRR